MRSAWALGEEPAAPAPNLLREEDEMLAQRDVTTQATGNRKSNHHLLQRIWRNRSAYVFVSPFYILFAIFFLVPSVLAFRLSLYRWTALSEARWLGTGNFERLIDDKYFWQSASNTAFYVIAALAIILPLALVMAAALNAPQLRFKSLWRAMYFAPMVTSIVAVALVFVLLYNRDYGGLNYGLGLLGIPPVNWLGDPTAARFAVVGLLTWRWTGFNAIFFLAAMQSIPKELYEAAMIDGAGPIQRFIRITIPQLRPVILYVTITIIVGTIQVFEEPFILTGGGPGNATRSLAQYMYEHGILKLRFGYASAIGVLIFSIVLVAAFVQFRIMGLFRED
jgi:multiple sugar transport system permease protein